MSSVLSNRVNQMDASGIRKVFDLAKSIKNPINLSIGQPDFDVPEEIKNEAIAAIQAGKNTYTQTQGIPELINKVKLKYAGMGCPTEAAMITSGVSGGLLLLFGAMLDEGDEVIFADPYFIMYKQLALMYNAKPIMVDCYPDFKLTAERIEPFITSKTKLICLNCPGNPTGVVMNEQEIKDISSLAKKHNITLVSDEIYDAFSYDTPFKTPLRYYENTVVLGGFSKSHGMTGWRMGYAVGSNDIMEAMLKIQQFTFVCAPSMAQEACIKAMDISMSEEVEKFKLRRNLIYDGLKDNFDVAKPDGAFYIFPKVPWGNGTDFVKKCIENNLLVIPGNIFSEKDTHFRISYAASEEVLLKGIDILNKLSNN